MSEQMWRCENWEKCTVSGYCHKFGHSKQDGFFCDTPCTGMEKGSIKGSVCKPVKQAFYDAKELTDLLPAEAVTVRLIDSLTATLIFDLLEERCPHTDSDFTRSECIICYDEIKKKLCGE